MKTLRVIRLAIDFDISLWFGLFSPFIGLMGGLIVVWFFNLAGR